MQNSLHTEWKFAQYLLPFLGSILSLTLSGLGGGEGGGGGSGAASTRADFNLREPPYYLNKVLPMLLKFIGEHKFFKIILSRV